MKNIILIVFTIIGILSCHSSKPNGDELFEGEMFLKLIDFGIDMYSKGIIDGKTFDELYEETPISQLTEEQVQFKKHYDLLRKNDLLDKPSFNFAEENSEKEFVKVYLSKKEYDKIKDINLSNLRSDGKKAEIKFYGKRISKSIVKCTSIEKVKTVKGKQQWGK